MIALIIILVGILIRLVAIRTLGRHFSLWLIPQDEIVMNGLYKYIRHPSYLGTMLVILGIAMLDTVLGIMAVIYIVFMERAVNEELILSQHPDYIKYVGHTGRFLPKIRRR